MENVWTPEFKRIIDHLAGKGYTPGPAPNDMGAGLGVIHGYNSRWHNQLLRATSSAESVDMCITCQLSCCG